MARLIGVDALELRLDDGYLELSKDGRWLLHCNRHLRECFISGRSTPGLRQPLVIDGFAAQLYPRVFD